MISPVRERPDHAVVVAEDAPTLYMLPTGRLSLWESPRVEHFRNLSSADGGHMVSRLLHWSVEVPVPLHGAPDLGASGDLIVPRRAFSNLLWADEYGATPAAGTGVRLDSGARLHGFERDEAEGSLGNCM